MRARDPFQLKAQPAMRRAGSGSALQLHNFRSRLLRTRVLPSIQQARPAWQDYSAAHLAHLENAEYYPAAPAPAFAMHGSQWNPTFKAGQLIQLVLVTTAGKL